MPTYVVLMNWTDQGAKNAKETVTRYHQATQVVERMGGAIRTALWTSGRYDLVVITEAPDDETISAILLALAAGGNLRTETMRAFDETEMQAILDKMP
jgi:uncharacterized protein with GYD domain